MGALILTPQPGDWAALLDAWDTSQAKVWYPTHFEFDGEIRDPVGFRLKGWPSLLMGSRVTSFMALNLLHQAGKFTYTLDDIRRWGDASGFGIAILERV